MGHTLPLSLPARLANRRGAVLLLAVYFASLMCLLFGGVSLQQTMIESRAALTSRDQHQAFHLAEAALDRALVDLRANISAIGNNTPQTVPAFLGQATYTVLTTSLVGQTPVTRRVTANGSINGRQQQIQADISEPPPPPPMQGLVTGGRVYLYGPSTALAPNQFMQVTGTVHAGGGNVGALEVHRSKITGSTSIGASRPDPIDWMWPGYSALIGPGGPPLPASFAGNYPGTYAGAQWEGGASSSDHFANPPIVEATLVPEMPDAQYGVRTGDPMDAALQQNQAACASGIALSGSGETADHQVIADGDAMDMTPPGDGKIAVCVTGVSLSGDSKLTFTSPATVYVVGGTYSQSGHATLQAVSGSTSTTPLPNGVEIVLPRWAPGAGGPGAWGYAGRFVLENWMPQMVILGGGTFHGSIWAPFAEIRIYSNRDAGDVLEPVNLHAYITRVWGASTHETFQFGSSEAGTAGGGASSTRPSLMRWSN